MTVIESHFSPGEQSLMVSAVTAAKMLAVSRSKWYQLVATGRAPKPVRLGRTARWLRNELEAWIAAGCPRRDS